MTSLTDTDLVRTWRQAWDGARDEAMGEILRRFLDLVDAQRSPATAPDLLAIDPNCMTCGTTCSVDDIPRCGTPGHGWTPRVEFGLETTYPGVAAPSKKQPTQATPEPEAVARDCTTCGTHCGHTDMHRCGTGNHDWTPRKKLPEIAKGCGSCVHLASPHYLEPCIGCYDPETQACTHKNHQPAQEPSHAQ